MRFETPGPSGGDMPDVRKLIEQWQHEAENRPPDGLFLEYRDTVAFSALERVPPANLTDATTIIDNTLQTIPWGGAHAPRQIASAVTNPSSMYNRALIACLDAPEAPETSQTFSFLSSYVQELPVGIASIEPMEQTIWVQKIRLLTCAYEWVLQKQFFEQQAYGTTQTSAEIDAFMETLQKHIRQVTETFQNGGQASPLDIVRVLDAEKALDEQIMLAHQNDLRKMKTTRMHRGVPPELYEIMNKARSKSRIEGHIDLFYLKIEEPLIKAWEHSQAEWTWTEINALLQTFPGVQSREMQLIITDALEDAGDSQLANVMSGAELAAEELAGLIHVDIYDNAGPVRMPAVLIVDKGDGFEDIAYDDVVLPRTKVPAAAVALLGDFAEKATADDLLAVLERMQQTIYGKPSSVATTGNEWLLTLALLRKNPDPRVRETVDAFITREDFPHAPFAQIISGEKSGHVFLTTSRKIRVDAKLSGGYVLASSPYIDPEEVPEAAREISAQRSTYSAPDRGPQSVPGKNVTKRRGKRAAGRPEEVIMPEPVRAQLRPTIKAISQHRLEEIREHLDATDFDIVVKALTDYQQHGQHVLETLNGRAGGAMMRKLRVNGVSNGIRVVLTHEGRNQYAIQAMHYRGAIYKDSVFRRLRAS